MKDGILFINFPKIVGLDFWFWNLKEDSNNYTGP